MWHTQDSSRHLKINEPFNLDTLDKLDGTCYRKVVVPDIVTSHSFF